MDDIADQVKMRVLLTPMPMPLSLKYMTFDLSSLLENSDTDIVG